MANGSIESRAPRATVLIAAVRDDPALRAMLRCVRAQADASQSEVLLVLNRKREEFDEAGLESLAEIAHRIEFEPIAGKSFALNSGVAAARGEIIAFTDDDTNPQPHWLERLIARLSDPDRDERLVAVGGPVIPVFDSDVPKWFQETVLSRDAHFLGPRHDYGNEPREYPIGESPIGGVPIGANFAARREVFDKFLYPVELGPSPETGLRGGEDTVFARDVLRAGYRIAYEPTAIVHHPVTASRSQVESAEAACFAQGRESILVRRHLGLPIPSRLHLLRKISKRRWRIMSERDGDDLVEHRLRLAELRGMHHQLQRRRMK